MIFLFDLACKFATHDIFMVSLQIDLFFFMLYYVQQVKEQQSRKGMGT